MQQLSPSDRQASVRGYVQWHKKNAKEKDKERQEKQNVKNRGKKRQGKQKAKEAAPQAGPSNRELKRQKQAAWHEQKRKENELSVPLESLLFRRHDCIHVLYLTLFMIAYESS